jgi:hypothetical protein
MIAEVMYIFMNLNSVYSAIHSENLTNEDQLVSCAWLKRPRLEDQCEGQWGNVKSYCPSKIPFSEISGPVPSVRNVLEAFK